MRSKEGLILVAILLTSLTLILNVNAETNVSGEITTDTTWTAANSPYVLSGDVLVKENVNLTIEQGVTVNLGAYALQVNGTLKAQCNSSSPIVFNTAAASSTPQIVFGASSKSWNGTDSTGCIIENATINTPISINGTSPMILSCKITGGITIAQAAPIIQSNTISGGNTNEAITIQNDSAPIILANSITGKTIGIYLNINSSSTATIKNNTIVNCTTGISVGDSNGTILLYGNLIYGSTYGVKVASINAAVTLQYNLLMNNTQGINVGSAVTININTIYNNTIGIYYDTNKSSTINYNNIMNNTKYNIEVTTNCPTPELEATYNYWGTQDIPTINASIYDKNDNSSLGTVKYLPALPEPWSGAPIISGVDMTPTTTPTPTNTPTATPTPTVKPTIKPTATPTPTPDVTQGDFGTLEIAIIGALIAIIVVFLVLVFRRTSKKTQNSPDTPTITG